jgi:hypothetical protein
MLSEDVVGVCVNVDVDVINIEEDSDDNLPPSRRGGARV